MDRKIEKKGVEKYKRWLWGAGAVCALGVVWLLLHSFSAGTVKVQKQKIQTAKIEKGNFDEFIAVSGVVQPLKTVIVVALQGGIVEEKYLEDGARLEKSVPVLKLSNQDLQFDFMNRETALLDQLNNLRNTTINLEQAHLASKQQLIQLENELKQAERIYFTNKRLVTDIVISKEEFRSSEDAYHSLKDRVALLRETVSSNERFKNYQSQQLQNSSGLIMKSLETLKQSMELLTIESPADGQLTGLNVEIGQHIEKGAKVAEVDLLKGYRVNAQVDELYISRISKGLKAKATFAGREYNMEVVKIYPQVTNGQFRVDLHFLDSFPKEMKYGQTLQIRLTLSEPTRSLLVKKGGFYQKTGGNWIFVVEDRRAVRRPIRLGRQNPDYLEVLEGLYEGEEVVISSYETLGDAKTLIITD